jgi:methionine-rich copper-binding protein CopC
MSVLVSRTVAALAVLAVAATASQVQAHAHLLSSDPAAGSTVAAPKAIVLHLSERLEPKFSGLELAKADGAAIKAAVRVPEADRKTIKAEPAQPLTAGAYKVSWHAVSADGHRTQGAFTFKVR